MPFQFFVMHSVNLERCNIFKAKLFSSLPNTWRTAAACSVLKGGLLSVTYNSQSEECIQHHWPIRSLTWQMYLPEHSWLALLITRRWVPGLKIPDCGREIQAPPGGKVSTRSCDQSSELRIEMSWPMRDYLSEARDDAVALRVVEIPLDGVNVLARGDRVGAGQDYLGPGLDNVCKLQILQILFKISILSLQTESVWYFFNFLHWDCNQTNKSNIRPK